MLLPYGRLAWAVAINLCFFGLFVLALPHVLVRADRSIEAVVYLPPPVKPTKMVKPRAAGGEIRPLYTVPDWVLALPSHPPPVEEAGRLALGRSLFSCASEHWDMLTESERHACAKRQGFAYDRHHVLMAPPPAAFRHEKVWRKARADSKAPTQLPGGVFGVLRSVVDGSVFDAESQIRNPDKWPTAQDQKIGNAEAQIRARNTTDLCAAAKASGSECITAIIGGKAP